jgi:hypothetical protein
MSLSWRAEQRAKGERGKTVKIESENTKSRKRFWYDALQMQPCGEENYYSPLIWILEAI